MESIRAALGVDKISFYGFSYGTYLGQVYATLHPDRVHRMVLDGVVDPGRVWYRSNLDQDLAFDRNIRIYFGWLARYDAVYHLGTTPAAVQKLFRKTQARLTAAPAGGVIGPDELTDVFLQAGYYVFGWEDVATAFAAWVNDHDPARLKALYDKDNPQTKGADNGYAIYLAVQCTDVRWPSSWRRWTTDNWRIHRRAPFETWANAWYNAPCRNWAGKPGTPVAVDGRAAPPVLLISETLDAATPFSGSLEVHRRFPRAALVEGVGGTTHAGSLFGGTCVDGVVAAYLSTGVLLDRVAGNRSDKRCAPLPQPNPAATPAPAARSVTIATHAGQLTHRGRYAGVREGE
jgi:pimeloyl-ACP methyl ester carboxylesterase